jgi:hypothetical protein
MSAQDYRVNAEVRRLLVSRWVDVSRVRIGTTNGIVYLMGTLEPSVEDALERSGISVEGSNPAERLVRLISLVEKELRRVRGVRDIVFNLQNLRRRGRAWSVVGASGSSVLQTHKVSITAAPAVEVHDEESGAEPQVTALRHEDGRNT